MCRQWAAGGARRGGASESGRAGALRLHPSRNGRRGTGAPRPMRLHNSRSISNIVFERCVQIMINVGRSNKFLHNFSTVLYISPVKTSSAHCFFERCAENLCFTLFFCPAVVKKHPETPQGRGGKSPRKSENLCARKTAYVNARPRDATTGSLLRISHTISEIDRCRSACVAHERGLFALKRGILCGEMLKMSLGMKKSAFTFGW